MKNKFIEHQYGNVRGMSKRDRLRQALEIDEREFKNLPHDEQLMLIKYITKSALFPEPKWKMEFEQGYPIELLVALKVIYYNSPTIITKLSDTFEHKNYYKMLNHFYIQALIFAMSNKTKKDIFYTFWTHYQTQYSGNFAAIIKYYDARNTKEHNGKITGIDFMTCLTEKIPLLIEIFNGTAIWIDYPKLPFFKKSTTFHKVASSNKPYVWLFNERTPWGETVTITKTFATTKDLLCEFIEKYSKCMQGQVAKTRETKTVYSCSSNYRNGRNISALELRYLFGIRGVEFGESFSQIEKQNHLNATYDALMDLAKLLEIDTFLIGLGELTLCFGSRGAGRAAATFNPSDDVINLTRRSGFGCLAHEIGHFYDYSIGAVAIEDKSFYENDLMVLYHYSNENKKVFSSHIQELKHKKESTEIQSDAQSLVTLISLWVKNPLMMRMLRTSIPNKLSSSQDVDTFVKIAKACISYSSDDNEKQHATSMLNKLLENSFEYTITNYHWVENEYSKASTLYAEDMNRQSLKSEEEMFARAFETYVASLFQENEHNHYLVMLNPPNTYPNDEELSYMAPIFKKYLTKFFNHIENTSKYQALRSESIKRLNINNKIRS